MNPRNSTTNWRLEPTLDEIKNEQRLHGLSFEDARKKLEDELAKDAELLSRFQPDAAQNIAKKIKSAQTAESRALEQLESSLAKIGDIKSKIVHLAHTRSKIRRIQQLVTSESDFLDIADRAIETWLVLDTPGGHSQHSRDKWKVALQELAFLSVLQRHLPTHIQKLESQATAVAAEIRSEGAKHKINLADVLAEMYRPKNNMPPDINSGHDLHHELGCKAENLGR